MDNPAAADVAPASVVATDMPSQLDRFNWNAVMWGAWWAAAYRVWPWFLLLTALATIESVIFILFNRSPFVRVVPIAIGAYLLGACLDWVPAVWLGFVANRATWARGHLSLLRKSASLESFLSTQRTWGLIGFGWLVLGRALRFTTISGPHLWSTAGFFAVTAFETCLIAGLWRFTTRRSGAIQHAHPADSAPAK